MSSGIRQSRENYIALSPAHAFAKTADHPVPFAARRTLHGAGRHLAFRPL